MHAGADDGDTRGQFIRFLLVGALNTAFGYAVFVLLVFAGLPSMPALVGTYVMGVLFNFATTRMLVFRRAAGAATFARFVAAYIVIYFFNAGLLKVLESAGVHPLAGQALCVPVVAAFSFFLFKLHVFK